MEIEVKLFADMRQYVPKEIGHHFFKIEISSTNTVKDILKRLGIPDELPKVVLVNGVHSSSSRPIEDGSVISIFSMISGG